MVKCTSATRLASFVTILFVADFASPTFAQGLREDHRLAQLQSDNVEKIVVAIRALDRETLHHDDIVGQLVMLLNDERVVRKYPMGRETIRDLAWFKLVNLEQSPVRSITTRLSKLTSDHAVGRAFEIIAKIDKPDGNAYQKTLPFCARDNIFLRSRAIAALGAVADNSPETVKQLGVFLKDPNAMVRWTVLDGLEDCTDHIAPLLPAIGTLLNDESDVYIAVSNHFLMSEKLRGRAARLLATVGPSAKEMLPKLRQLTAPEFNTNVRIWCATAICTISDNPPPKMLELLGQLLLLDKDNEYVDNDAAEAIQKLGPRATPLLDQMENAKQHRSSAVRWGVAEAFFAVDPESAVKRVLPMMRDEDELVVETVIEMLTAHGARDPAVIDAYIRALDDYEGLFDQPSSSAVAALEKLGPTARKAIPALKQLSSNPEISDTLREDVNGAITAIETAQD